MTSKDTSASPFPYFPKDDLSKQIETALQTHPLTKALRSNPAFIEDRLYSRTAKETCDISLTAGTLRGPTLVAVPPLTFQERNGKSLYVLLHLGTAVCAFHGVVHGGLLATILDEALGAQSFSLFPNRIAMTASLTTKFLKPAPADNFYIVKVETIKVEGRTAWLEGGIEILGPDTKQLESFGGKLVAKAKGMYVSPSAKSRIRALI